MHALPYHPRSSLGKDSLLISEKCVWLSGSKHGEMWTVALKCVCVCEPAQSIWGLWWRGPDGSYLLLAYTKAHFRTILQESLCVGLYMVPSHLSLHVISITALKKHTIVYRCVHKTKTLATGTVLYLAYRLQGLCEGWPGLQRAEVCYMCVNLVLRWYNFCSIDAKGEI